MSTGGPGHTHAFDPISGWCAYCNFRQDGRLISPGGHVWHPGDDTHDDTHEKAGARA